MAQRLILEGNEGYVLSEILKLSNSRLPSGYPTTEEYVENFLRSVRGVRNVRGALVEQIKDVSVTNVGIIVDANSKGAKARFDSIHDTVREYLPEAMDWAFSEEAPYGWIGDLTPNFRLGLWVMPNNRDNGYFEHFLTELIAPTDASFIEAQEILSSLQAKGKRRFKDIRTRKALLALFLAIQEEPGMSELTALRKGLLRHEHPLAKRFVRWYEETFTLTAS